MAASVHEQIQVALQATREKTRQAAIAAARAENDRIMTTDPRPGGVTVTVDGVVGAPIESVKLGGVIDFKYWRGDDVAALALKTLRDLSPVGVTDEHDPHPGQYRDAHRIYLNGQVVDSAAAAGPGDDLYIMNTLPYARKIEVGTETMRVPGTDHVYQQAAQVLAGNADAKFTFSYRGDGGRGTRYPALVITRR